MDEKPDFGSTTAVIVRKVRKYLTPSTVWGAIGTLTVAIGYVLNAQLDISHLKETVGALESQRKEASVERDQDRELLHKIDTTMAVMNGKVDTIADEVDRQRQWREHVEGIAEAPPHSKRRR